MELWQRYLNVYSEAVNRHCEKTLGFISEPVNTVSNIAFFVSAFLTYKLLAKNRVTNPHIPRLLLLIILIGVGSTLYHGFNSPYTLILDQTPIYAFLIYSLYLITGYATKSNFIKIFIPLVLAGMQIWILKNAPAFILNIPTSHLINLLYVSLLIIWLYKKLGKVVLNIILIVFIYGIAALSRTFDPILCPINKFGTHVFWHILMATVLYLTTKFLIEVDKKIRWQKVE